MRWVGESGGRRDIRLGRCLCAWTETQLDFSAEKTRECAQCIPWSFTYMACVQREKRQLLVFSLGCFVLFLCDAASIALCYFLCWSLYSVDICQRERMAKTNWLQATSKESGRSGQRC
jgi:hypothetical protein